MEIHEHLWRVNIIFSFNKIIIINVQWNDNELMSVGTAAAERLFARHGIHYRVGNQALILCRFNDTKIVKNY